MFSNPSCSAKRKSLLGTHLHPLVPSGGAGLSSHLTWSVQPPTSPSPATPALSQAADRPALVGGEGAGAAQVEKAGQACSPPRSPPQRASPCLPFGGPGALGRNDTGWASRQTGRGFHPQGVTQPRNLPGSSCESRPRNPRSCIFQSANIFSS